MKVLKWAVVSTLCLAVVLGSLVLWVKRVAVPLDQQPLPDPGQVIRMPDGTERTLTELLAASRIPEAPTSEPAGDTVMRVTVDGESAMAEGLADHEVQELVALEAHEALERLRQLRENRWKDRVPDGSDLFQLAEYALDADDVDAALALYRSVPSDHPHHERAQRRIGWDIYTKKLGDPRRGVPYVQASLVHDPTNGNAWQDLVRVYGHTLGIPVD